MNIRTVLSKLVFVDTTCIIDLNMICFRCVTATFSSPSHVVFRERQFR